MTSNNDFVEVDHVISHSNEEVNELIRNSEQASVFEDYIEFQVFVVRRLLLEGNSLKFQSEAFVVLEKSIYYFDRNEKKLSKLSKGIESLLEYFVSFYQQNGRIINGYFAEIENLENKLFDRNVPSYFMDLWFNVKRDLAKVENFYFRNAVVYKEFLSRMGERLKALGDEFKDIDETIQFQNSNILTFKGRLDSLHHYHDAIKSDRLNNTLLLLTIISGVFLPLNLIVGFFGMNTHGLFFEGNPYGTENVLYLLGGVVVFCLVGMRVLKVIDRYIFRNFLGRYDFYKKLLSRFEDIDAKLRGH